MDTTEAIRTLKAMQTEALGHLAALAGLRASTQTPILESRPGAVLGMAPKLAAELKDAMITARNHAQAIGHAIGRVQAIISGDAAREEVGR